ncbi:MAG: hypothetical protein A2493_02640 [Candidatus Magasanikbacteria bacterium RIFOXYC12_FULL_33_11]|uniref:Uncharacterized protein n=1 Tax=Candidatus Magasanikbacteria bacterium RIFOXYC12_FULL_33_11 TaxID=1798701 RepID=A0A1F6NRL3_9BACT|nr:MAG: hypothetical protein A2493_02640 [Candidatus Magasanikbacteria bacterium RIFOXYC12_FULL_33_11]
MKEKIKKEVNEWYLAATYWLTVIVVPFALVFLFGMLTVSFFGVENITGLMIISYVIYILGLWLGVKYASNYLDKNYIVKDKNRLIKLSTLYLFVVGLVIRLYEATEGINAIYIIDLLFFFVLVTLFYFFSKKYLKNNFIN